MTRPFCNALRLGVICAFAIASQAFKEESYRVSDAVQNRPLPFAGNGTCDEPVSSDGETSVRCLGPEMPMLPGQTIDAYILLESPYPADRNVTVLKQEAQMVARTGPKTWREVPLSELYFHHVVPNPRFLIGAGAEIRGSRLRKALDFPYAFIVDGEQAAAPANRLTNIQLVNTIGVPSKDVQQSIECWCGHEELGEASTRGSLFCCRQRQTFSTAGPEMYQLEYNITYRDVKEGEQKIDFLAYDATGGKLEYNIPTPRGPGTEHTVAIETEVDSKCPQKEPFTIVRCTAHQHIGSKCVHVYNLDADEPICSSCTVYGNETGTPGNELGYVVAIQDGNPVYKINPGTRIRVESVYDGSQKRLGIMGFMGMWVNGLTRECGQNSSQDAMTMMAEAHSLHAVRTS